MPTGSTERKITITGPVPECISAMQKITRYVEQKLTDDDIGPHAVLKIVVPLEAVPHLRRSGAMIKHFQDLSHAHIQVDQDSPLAPGVVGRAVTIQGVQFQRNMAAHLILRLLSELRLSKEWHGGRPSEVCSDFPPPAATIDI